MTHTTELRFPESPSLLAELNLPDEVIDSVLGRIVTVRVLPEERALTRRIDPQLADEDDSPFLIDRDGICWNDYRPVRVHFSDHQGRVWRLPRFWLHEVPQPTEVPFAGEEAVISEEINLPTDWDLLDVNITSLEALRAAGQRTHVVVNTTPGGAVKVFWCDPEGATWRLPHDWRRRLVKLPSGDALASQGVPEDVAIEFSQRVVAVNYHPGSLCCLPEYYRFRDGRGGKWPVRMADCAVVGFGNKSKLAEGLHL